MQDTADSALAETFVARLIRLLQRHHNLLALGSFLFGLASFLLVQRREHAAQILVIALPLTWLLMLAENSLGEWFRVRLGIRLPPVLLRYAVQCAHQETFFFTLPFFFYTTTWRSGQAVFTGLLALAALVTVIDPLYYRQVAARRSLDLALHALSVFVATLTATPMLWHLTTTQSLQIAAIAVALLSTPTLARIIGVQRPGQWLLLVSLTLALGLTAWLARPWIPPATLWMTNGVVTHEVDADARMPQDTLSEITAEEASRGLCGWTAIRAPRGLDEGIHHLWSQNGTVLDDIPLKISGGREQGYRAWSCKQNMPADPRGRWQVRVITDGGQLIGVLRFTVR
ncbi:MAG: DUF5924 family protein [Stenotrophobium sp.]